MAFDISGFGGGFSGFDSSRVRAESGLEDITGQNSQIAGQLASQSLGGYGQMLQAKEMAKAYKDQAKAKSGGGLGGIFEQLAGPVAGSFLGPIGGAAGKALSKGLFG
jgi:hypothetical protein